MALDTWDFVRFKNWVTTLQAEDSGLGAYLQHYVEAWGAERSGYICGFCNKGGADKIPHPIRWPGEESAGTEFVHKDCEDAECRRAHSMLSSEEIAAFLYSLK